MTTEPQTEHPLPSSSAPSVAMWFAFVVLAAGILTLWMLKNTAQQRQPPSRLIGLPAPEIRAQGWLNGPAPTDEELAGKVVLIDAWAYWCGPCLAEAPHLVALYEKFKDRGVIFLGLTGENAATLDKSRRFLELAHITWRQGYGAGETLEELEAHYIPRVYIIGKDGRIAWDNTAADPLEDVLERLISAE